jgi:hypothetical protein
MQRGLFAILFVLAIVPSSVDAACIDPATLANSTARIARYFDDNDKDTPPGVVGISGTGWFISPMSIATVEHVAAAMKLSNQTWTQVELRKGDHKQSIPARIQRLLGSSVEKIAVLELKTAFPGAQSVEIRMEPLAPGEPLLSLAYPGDQLRIAGGRFVQYGDGGKFAGTALLEMYDGNDRLVLDHGASGAPVLDCEGRAVAVVSNLFTTTMQFMSSTIRISTAWGNPNVASVPIQAMKDLARAD